MQKNKLEDIPGKWYIGLKGNPNTSYFMLSVVDTPDIQKDSFETSQLALTLKGQVRLDVENLWSSIHAFSDPVRAGMDMEKLNHKLIRSMFKGGL